VFGTFAVITLFLFHSGGGKEYQSLTGADPQEAVLDVEQIIHGNEDDEDAEEDPDD
jgi:hypothetical protein